MFLLLNKIRYWIFIVYLSIKWMFKTNLGNYVWYKGKKHIVCNGVISEMWRLGDLDNGHEGWVPRKECKLVLSADNIFHSFKWGYGFYMGYWYDIWVREGIKDWMKGCRIWASKTGYK
jgi:hypothetical protein